MKHRLLWKLSFVFVTGVVALFYLIDYSLSHTKEKMSLLTPEHQQELYAWSEKAERMYNSGRYLELQSWLNKLQDKEQTSAAIIKEQFDQVAGFLDKKYFMQNNLGRGVDWKIHLWFDHNPLIEIPFESKNVSFVIVLPDRMRPGSYWNEIELVLRIIFPVIILAIISWLIYQHIMKPLNQLERATKDFSQGDFSVRISGLLGNRKDELSHLAETFDQMATIIGEQIISQRQLIADLSHELRTPLTRLDIAVNKATQTHPNDDNLQRVCRESKYIRKLMEDTLALAWLENERPKLQEETLDLIDLIDVILDDAAFEFPKHTIELILPTTLILHQSNHRAVGQALENIVRNALRYTPEDKKIIIELLDQKNHCLITVTDQGPGVPEDQLEAIFRPFFRVDESRTEDSFGLGLALARRQLASVGGDVRAKNCLPNGLCICITLPKNNQ